MLTNNTIVGVTNRSDSLVGYVLPEMHIKRRFAKNETKQLTVEEVRALAAARGGLALIKENLIINNEELANEIIYNIQPEYYYTDKEVVELLLNGTEDQLLDTLDFGPEGVHDLIKKKAVELKLNNVRKREIIFDKTGFNVTKAIEINAQTEKPQNEVSTRRAAPINTSSASAKEETVEAPQRRTVAPKYKVTITE